MDTQEVLQAYIDAVIPERDRYLERQVLRKAGGKCGGGDAEASGPAFESALYHLRRADKVSRALLKGELPTEYYRTEFDLLAPLIEADLKDGREIDLAFLRSVQRSRVPAGTARAAVRLMEGERLRVFLDKRLNRVAALAEEKTAGSTRN